MLTKRQINGTALIFADNALYYVNNHDVQLIQKFQQQLEKSVAMSWSAEIDIEKGIYSLTVDMPIHKYN